MKIAKILVKTKKENLFGADEKEKEKGKKIKHVKIIKIGISSWAGQSDL